MTDSMARALKDAFARKGEPIPMPDIKRAEPANPKRTERDQGTVPTRKPTVAKHQPRLTATPEEMANADKKRTPMRINISTMSDAELARAVRNGMLYALTEGAAERREAAITAKVEATAADNAKRQAERDSLHGQVLKGFTFQTAVETVTVPEIKLADVHFGETAPAALVQPYNSIRHHLGEEILDREETSWSTLCEQHKQLAKAAKAQAKAIKAKRDQIIAGCLARGVRLSRAEADTMARTIVGKGA